MTAEKTVITVYGEKVNLDNDSWSQNFDNTSDANKPISKATQRTLNSKANDNTVVHL